VKEMEEGFEIKHIDGATEMKLLTSNHTDEDYAELFVDMYDSFKAFGDHIYRFKPNNHTWSCGDDGLIYEFLGSTVYGDLRELLDKRFNNIAQADQHAEITRMLLILRSCSGRKGIVQSIIPKITSMKDISDQKPELCGFNNGVYDLLKCEFRDGRVDDFDN
jgi:hypothetical protein